MPRPFVHINLALSSSGGVAGDGGGISCRQDWARVHELRERYDAVAVGACTWNTDHPRLTVRAERLGRDPRRQPLRVIFAGSKHCALPATDTGAIVIGQTSPSPGVTHVPASGHELAAPLESLWRHGVRSMLVEGGPTLIRSFLQQGVCDAVTAYVRRRCADSAMRAIAAIVPEVPLALRAERLGEGILLSCPAAPPAVGAVRKADPVRFVIIAAPRTGSNMLCSMLNSHPEILCHHEIFNPAGIHYALDHRDGQFDLGSEAERDLEPEVFVRRVFEHRCGRNAIGFKLNRGQNERAFEYLLADRSVRKIVLRRRNRVKTFVSELIAQRTGQWESYAFSDFSAPSPAVEVNVDRLSEYLAATDRYYAEVESLLDADGQPYLGATYEDLEFTAEQSRILAFLDVTAPAAPLLPATRKRNPTDLRALVSNFGELHSALWTPELKAELESAGI